MKRFSNALARNAIRLLCRPAFVAGIAAVSLASCAKLSPGGASLGDPCLVSSDCADPYICVSGTCTPSAGQLCTAATLRCNGNDVESCDPSGDAWTVVQMCTIGCVQGACVPPICAAGVQQCMNGTINECLSDGSRWVPVTTCLTSCVPSSTDPTKVECSEPICTPLETECNSQMPGVLETCSTNGTTWNSTPCSSDPTAPAACVSGECEPIICTSTPDPSNAGSFIREERCDGPVAEQCNDTGTAYEEQINGICSAGCVAMADGGYGCATQICVPLTTSCDPTDPTGTTLLTCNSTGTMTTSSSCATPDGMSVCANGQCSQLVCNVSKDSTGAIIGRDQECNGEFLEQCNDSQTGWENIQTCQYGCVTGTAMEAVDGGVPLQTATCGPQVCQAGQGACETTQTGAIGQALELCNPDLSGYSFVQYCPTGCTVNNSAVPPSAACNPPVCAALTRCCSGDPGCGTDPNNAAAVFICASDGTGYQEGEICAQSCVAGSCADNSTQCTVGDVQCVGQAVQQCVTLTDDNSTSYVFVEQCLGSCVSGACDNSGACGCDPPAITNIASQSLQCGGHSSGAPQPITLNAMLPAGTQVPCGDGVSLSQVLVYCNPIVDEFGTLVPDGTMVTFANDSIGMDAGSMDPNGGVVPDSLILSADSDPSEAGIQRPTQNGVAIAMLSAPAQNNCGSGGSRTVTVTATIGGAGAACSGTLPVSFVADDTSMSRTVYIAQDFSATTVDDPINTPAPEAQWNTQLSEVVSLPGFSLGSGGDGPVTIPILTTSNCVSPTAEPAGYFCLDQSGFAPSWDVTAVTSNGAAIDGMTTSLTVGDEVLIATVWGPPGSTGPGNYEFHHVAALNDNGGFGALTFTEPVNTYFGNATNADLTGHRVTLQRVPQFASLDVPSTATLTSSPMSTGACNAGCTPTGGTGILAFRVAGTLTVSGGISMDDTGLPANLNAYPNTGTTPSLNRFLQGLPQSMSGSGVNSGGGVVFATAETVMFGGTLPTIHASIGSGGGGGTVWLSSANLRFGGQIRVVANGTFGGHTRLDYSSSDFLISPSPQQASGVGGTTFVGPESGGEWAQTSTVYLETTNYSARQATLFGLIGGSETSTVAIPSPATLQLLPGENIWLTSDGATTWGDIDTGTLAFVGSPTMGQAGTGRDVRFRMLLAPQQTVPLEVRGVAFSVELQ